MPIIKIVKGAVFVRLPIELQRPINWGCDCPYCKAHPEQSPMWDALGVPTFDKSHTWTVHMPEVPGVQS